MSRAALVSKLRLNRAQWVKLVSAARGYARAAEVGDVGEGPGNQALAGAIEAFHRELRGAAGESFPDGQRIASTAQIAQAFVHAGRAFAMASPERRSAIAPALGQLAGLLDGFLEEKRAAEARGQYWAERD
jgi:hypothetical protein